MSLLAPTHTHTRHTSHINAVLQNSVPMEIKVVGDKEPIYDLNLEELGRFNEQPVLPFNAYGTLAWARAEFDNNRYLNLGYRSLWLWSSCLEQVAATTSACPSDCHLLLTPSRFPSFSFPFPAPVPHPPPLPSTTTVPAARCFSCSRSLS